MENESLGKVFSRVQINPSTRESSRLFGIIRSRGNDVDRERERERDVESNYDREFLAERSRTRSRKAGREGGIRRKEVWRKE